MKRELKKKQVSEHPEYEGEVPVPGRAQKKKHVVLNRYCKFCGRHIRVLVENKATAHALGIMEVACDCGDKE